MPRVHAQTSIGGSGPAPSATPYTVVLVEDDAGLRSALERLLVLAGYRVESFLSAEDFLAAGDAVCADCLVCDIQLPGESGIALARRLARSGARTPVIFITAHDRPGVHAESEALRAADYLVKPFAGQRLVEAIRATLPAS